MPVKRSQQTLGELKRSGYKILSVKDEIRKNLVQMLKSGQKLFTGIIGYDKTAIPGIQNAILARHDFILLGLRGQAKTRILRSLVDFLDEYVPMIEGCQLNDNPYEPICKRCKKLLEQMGDKTPIVWFERHERYNEKLATPDVTIADLIGDIDPIKAASMRLSLADEEVMHFGIIPRTNRGIFAINELPDLNTRIQVGLLNIMEERDIQIRGFPVRLNLDLLLVFTANPEDYTNRGTIITPLKDRIGSQIMTHYLENIDEAVQITEQEAWIKRSDVCNIHVPKYIKEIVEEIAVVARKIEFVDQASGVSARVPISAMEDLISNIERRALITGERHVMPRICDLYSCVAAVAGKIQLVYEGEQQGVIAVSKRVIGNAINNAFLRYFPKPYKTRSSKKKIQQPESQEIEDTEYKEIIDWFAKGNNVDITDEMSTKDYVKALGRVDGLKKAAETYMKPEEEDLPLCMELVLEGLYQNSTIAKEERGATYVYKDILKTLFESIEHD